MGRGRENEPPMPEPLAYFLTWSTYGTWLPGDERGWIEYGHGWLLPDAVRKLEAEASMTEEACRLDGDQRDLVERQIAETCKVRGTCAEMPLSNSHDQPQGYKRHHNVKEDEDPCSDRPRAKQMFHSRDQKGIARCQERGWS